MAKKAEDDLTKHTLNLFPGDYARLQELYPETGAGPVIRRIIRDFIAKVDAAATTPVKEDVHL